ncbi:MAG: hypothetical protein A3E83_05185 [Gammaproteobacteria bacterium RIFCSPHIGHO2_12_FULL_41_20]|nr:MAG: hypothetical protein A3E83_05185 [Gammaproteobacteria bacterium RIFCSPHIGHO2_12_FULL_41_20]
MKIILKLFFIISILFFVATAYSIPPFKAAAIEFNPEFLAFDTNLPKLVAVAEGAAKQGAKLIVLPEMATSGYIYANREQIMPYLDTIPGKTTAILAPIAKKYHVYIAVGIAEIDKNSRLAYNSAALIGPQGYIGKYRKNGLNSDDTKWAVRGNLGFPVFDTELGKIALVICYDDSYLQSLLLPAVRGANIIAYLTSSDRLPKTEMGWHYNHSTIANIATFSGWMGTYIIGSSRTGLEKNPLTGAITHYVGGASIWDPDGKNLAQAAPSFFNQPSNPETIYAQIDPQLYNNSAKQVLLTRRRPELYSVMNLYRAPLDPDASTQSHKVQALVVQYSPKENDKDTNLKKIKELLLAEKKNNFDLVVLPENSLLGTQDPQSLRRLAEDAYGDTFQAMVDIAQQYHVYLVYGFPEKTSSGYYASVMMIDPNGKSIALYHKSHLNEVDKNWARAGDVLPVVDTSLGRIAFMLGDEVRVPDITNIYAMKRADIIIIPTAWTGDYGREVYVDPGLLMHPYPQHTMTMWYSVAKYAQAYTLVANYIGGKNQYKGGSGLYALDPVEGHYIPEVTIDEKAFRIQFNTIGSNDWWMNQAYLIIGQRVELNPPLTLSDTTACFKLWQQNTAEARHFCW